MIISLTEENYLKAIYTLSHLSEESEVTTNQISDHLSIKAATVTDMLKRLAEKKLINYIPYQGVKLSDKGKQTAIKVVRKHRLWEVFLVDKLNFKWDEVHEIAEQLEHIQSDELIQRLDTFLGKPKFDPHGDPIPDANGLLNVVKAIPLNQNKTKGLFVFVGVCEHSKTFLQHLTSIGLKIGDSVKVEEINEFDNSYKVKINKNNSQFFSNKVASNILVEIKK
ncbi:MAG: metal-dependent transcriptional regulator [Bacteroidia bacterium]